MSDKKEIKWENTESAIQYQAARVAVEAKWVIQIRSFIGRLQDGTHHEVWHDWIRMKNEYNFTEVAKLWNHIS